MLCRSFKFIELLQCNGIHYAASINRAYLNNFPIFVPSQRLIHRNIRELFSSNRGVLHLNEACRIDELSRGFDLGRVAPKLVISVGIGWYFLGIILYQLIPKRNLFGISWYQTFGGSPFFPKNGAAGPFSSTQLPFWVTQDFPRIFQKKNWCETSKKEFPPIVIVQYKKYQPDLPTNQCWYHTDTG